MATIETRGATATHEVLNQASPLENYNVFAADRVLVEALRREGARLGRRPRIGEVGAFAGSAHRPALGSRGEREPAEAPSPTTASATGSTRSSSTPPGTS